MWEWEKGAQLLPPPRLLAREAAVRWSGGWGLRQQPKLLLPPPAGLPNDAENDQEMVNYRQRENSLSVYTENSQITSEIIGRHLQISNRHIFGRNLRPCRTDRLCRSFTTKRYLLQWLDGRSDGSLVRLVCTRDSARGLCLKSFFRYQIVRRYFPEKNQCSSAA